MASSITFARHFAQLLLTLGFNRASVEEQKLNLRAAMAATKGGSVRMHVAAGVLYADDEPVSPIFTGVRELIVQLDGHGVAGVEAAEDAAPADLLLLARALAAPFAEGSGLGEVLAEKAPATVRVAFAAHQPVAAPPAPAPAPTPQVVEPEDVAPMRPTPASEDAMPSLANDAASLFSAVAGARTAREAVPGLLAALGQPQSPQRLARMLDELCTFVEVTQREGAFDDTLRVYHGLCLAEPAMDNAESRRALIVSLRRLAKPAVLEAIVRLAVRQLPADPRAVEVLQRVGDDGVLAIVERAVQARSVEARERLLGLLRALPSVGMALGQVALQARPVAARQAARLATELGATDAEPGLSQAAEQAKPEVRRDALVALAALASPRASEVHVRALHDDDVTVRLQAVAGLAALRPTGAVAALAAALTDESEPEVQVALVQAIGRVASPDSLEHLTKAAEPAKGLFRRKSLALRVAAVHALAQLRLPGVSSVLNGLQQDKERMVRDALVQATRVHGRRTTRAMVAVQG
jgi:HEAT repeat protein